MERVGGNDPPSVRWQRTALPLSYTRVRLFSMMAEEVGFEPTVPYGTSHFKCGALDHSATLPVFLETIFLDLYVGN